MYRTRHLIVVTVVLASSFGIGCASLIGDDCGSNADCGPGRICDKSLPGGYCTTTPCEVNDCPDEAVCIEFPDGQSYCMKHCGSDGDCRGGSYECVEDWGDGYVDEETGLAPPPPQHPYCGVPF